MIVSSAVLQQDRPYTAPGPKRSDIFEELESQLSTIYPSISFNDLTLIANKVYHCYMTTKAHESALGDTERLSEHYGEAGSSVEPLDQGAEKLGWHGDRQMANLVLRMRDGFWYHELCYAIGDGDIGRVSEIIKVNDQSQNYPSFLPIYSFRFCGSPFGVLEPPIMAMSSLSMQLYLSMSTPKSCAKPS